MAEPCTVAWCPLVGAETRCVFGYHRHDEGLPMGQIPGELTTVHPACIVRSGEFRLEFEPSTGIIYETPLLPGSPQIAGSSAAPARRLIARPAEAEPPRSPAASQPALAELPAICGEHWVSL